MFHLKTAYDSQRAIQPAMPACPAIVWVTGDDRPDPLLYNNTLNVVVVPRAGPMRARLAQAIEAQRLELGGLRQVADPVPGSDGYSSSKLRDAVKRHLRNGASQEQIRLALQSASDFMTAKSAQNLVAYLVETLPTIPTITGRAHMSSVCEQPPSPLLPIPSDCVAAAASNIGTNVCSLPHINASVDMAQKHTHTSATPILAIIW